MNPLELTSLLPVFILIPLAGFTVSLMVPEKNERLLSRIAFFTTGLNLAGLLAFLICWFIQGHPDINLEGLNLYETDGYTFMVEFFFDDITATYLGTGYFLTFLITIYSRYYLHREQGYKRFFNTVLFFFAGYNITVLSGNFETLFMGWEILGISSFLLIAFYRDRYFPVHNAVKVFSIYRIGDVGILLAMWASHHLWHENISFIKLSNDLLVHEHLEGHSAVGIFIAVMLLLAAAAKSAQLPFSSWLPRAMEGPTPSSAIFYGSLSVHFGVFLLLRTSSFWEEQLIVRVMIGILGLATALVASPIARVQSSIKTQIAYGSITQIGIMFIEVAAGFHTIALIHFAGNAFLRTYQLLVSPSVVSYLIREQFYNFRSREDTLEDTWRGKFENTLYILSLKEWHLDSAMNRLVFSPLKHLGRKFNFLTYRNVLFFIVPAYLIGILLFCLEDQIPDQIHRYLPELFSLTGMLLSLKAFSERVYPRLAWILVTMNHLWVALAISFNEHFDITHSALYLSGILPLAVIGYLCLQWLNKHEHRFSGLNQYYGHVYEYPNLAFLFLISCLGLMGFPITYSFIGEDLIFSHIHETQYWLALFCSVGYIMGGIALVRMYARLFLGPHVKHYHETPNTTS